MDTAGAVAGPLLGYAYLANNPGAFRNLYLLALIPGLLGVAILWMFVREGGGVRPADSAVPPFSVRVIFSGLSPEYRRYLLIVALFALGNSSDAFLILRS